MKKILIFSITLNLLLQQIFTQKYIQSNSSQSDVMEFARYGSTQYCGKVDQTANLSNNFSQQFNSVPQIFIGILFFDLGTTTLRNAFNFTVKSVNQNQVSIQLNKYGETCIFGIKISYFATVDQDVQIQNYILTLNQLSDIQTQNNKQYQFKIPQKLGYQRGVQCAITGFDSIYSTPPSTDTNYSHRNLATATQVDSSNNFYQIQIEAPDLSVNLKIIYINCIEYYIWQADDYSMINNIQQEQTTQSITSNYNFQINLDSSFIGNSITSFLGLQQFDLSQQAALRLEYNHFFFLNNQYYFQVNTWSSSILYSSKALFFQHQMIDCKSSFNEINSNDLKKCVSKCQDGQYAVQFQTTQVCSNCDPSCLTCQNSSTQCLSCPQGLFLYNQKCIQCCKSLNQLEMCQTQFLLDQATGKCYCSNPQQYYSTELQSCFQNNIHFCKVSSKFQNTCEQCQDGYYNYNKLICSYCGKSKYTDSQNQCNNDCQPQCIICSNKSTCLLFQDEVNSNTNGNLPINPNQNICHYSCGQCNGSGQSNCLTCSSQTRVYDIQQQTCNCKSGKFDKGDAECQTAFDFQQNYLWILQTIFIIFLITQSTLVFSSQFRKANLNFYLIQQLIFISYDNTLSMSLNYAQTMKQFQYLSLVTAIPISIVDESNSQIIQECNQIVILLIFQVAALSIFFIQYFLKYQKLKYFDKEILFSCNRLTSTINIALILQLIIKEIKNIYKSTLVLLVIASLVQLILQIIVFRKIYLDYKGNFLITSQQKNTLNLSLIYKYPYISFQTREQYLILKAILEVKRIINALVFALFSQYGYQYQILSGISLFIIIIILYLKPFHSLLANLEAIVIEFLISSCFLLHSFYSKNIFQNNDASYLLFIMITIIFVQLFAIIQCTIQILFFIYQKIKSYKSKSSNQATIELLPQYIQKDTIDHILASKMFNYKVFRVKNNNRLQI
ncbi:H-type lectin domain protein (macronuclear) [Tetrahymena thermophila SB210]|uniref:H-type lectin domain protein n=1 Tax=Tetrahymena thermophila (strain SB210) TaxID=312017 RepID=Q22P13_TETTS|nr:H-type lectin domain protein [Tetrahymena thermophila SB210]EAR86998.2 H-type lectin domain protein [Tetrahymena thermophila SB210]|eukprot:XP_001007243.2 H-type lectin domain protein [Tetrahymena thermophila SB210]